jgi:5-methylcytosine-specific restriction endonuclease McrBC regulatory subunit McrC
MALVVQNLSRDSMVKVVKALFLLLSCLKKDRLQTSSINHMKNIAFLEVLHDLFLDSVCSIKI